MIQVSEDFGVLDDLVSLDPPNEFSYRYAFLDGIVHRYEFFHYLWVLLLSSKRNA
jgi:hypothetical protein